MVGSVLLLLPVAACSDDDDGARDEATTSTTAAGFDRTVELAGRPSAVAYEPTTGVWVADDAEGVARGRALLGPAPSGPREDGLAIEVGPAPVAIAPFAGGVWVVGATGTVTRLVGPEPGMPQLPGGATVEVGGALVDAVVVGDRLYVGDIEAGVVHVLDATTGAAVDAPLAVPAGVVRLAAAEGRLWVTGLEADVTPVDLATGVVGAPVGVGAGPIGLAVVDGVLWVADSDDDTVTRLDATTGTPLGAPVPVGDAPIAVAAADGVVWVLGQDDRTVTQLDAVTGEPLGPPVALPMRPRGMALVPGTGAWVIGVDPSLAVRIPIPDR